MTSVLLLCSTVCAAWLTVTFSPYWQPAILPLLSLVGLLVASVACLLKRRFSYIAGAIGAVLGLYSFARVELWEFPALNSWIIFNARGDQLRVSLAAPRIAFVVITTAAAVACSLRLLPSSWFIFRKAIRDRIWPVFTIPLAVVIGWYLVSVSPYRIPLIVDGPSPELAILHIQKDGLELHEAEFSVYLGREFYFSRDDRRLLQYEFAVRGGHGVLTEGLSARVQALAQSLPTTDLHTPLPKPLRAWRGEGWYVRAREGIFAFTTENRTEPPKEVVTLFRDFFVAVPRETPLPHIRDVCFGFCYDPSAALGMAPINRRCRNGMRCE